MHFFFFFQAEDGIRDLYVTGVQTCALPIFAADAPAGPDRLCGCSLLRHNAEALGAGIAVDAPVQPRRREAPALDAKPAHSAASSSSAISATAGRGPMTPSSIAAQLGQATAST